MDFWISDWISGFHSGFLDFTVDFWISQWISGFQFGFLPTVYEISFVTDPSILLDYIQMSEYLTPYTYLPYIDSGVGGIWKRRIYIITRSHRHSGLYTESTVEFLIIRTPY